MLYSYTNKVYLLPGPAMTKYAPVALTILINVSTLALYLSSISLDCVKVI